MAVITVRNLDDKVKHRLRVRAARHGRSMEAEVRAILVDAVDGDGEVDERENLGMALHRRFAEIGGVDLELPARTGTIRSVDFD
ncbi:FitA-like ribbon-helix-helix domain-containing protein [Kribbella sp. CA-294648]|uniref:FitA-like ribbon-helix-helix domain-containing protein n=1 Tax=Kribbella sp. CA-294648 TaxID=3239948 RepID=UPI003D8E67B3